MPETAVHLHWCPGCDSTWDCAHALLACPIGGTEVVTNHCDAVSPLDELD